MTHVDTPQDKRPTGDKSELDLSFGKWKASATNDKAIEALERVAKLYRPVVISAIVCAIAIPFTLSMLWLWLKFS